MSHAQALASYLGAFIDELALRGLEQVCLCPGSRSTPLALLFSKHPRIRTWVHLDERSCAYFALGMAKASRRPVAVLCTSGTAALNFGPAVVEAYHAGVPLLVLTADRPPELRDVGANQTIDQHRLYGSAVKWAAEMLLPEDTPEALRHARLSARRGLAASLDQFPGPVHLNFPLREPLVLAEPRWSALDASPAVPLAVAHPSDDAVTTLAETLSSARAGLIVCGPQEDTSLPAPLATLARRLGWPLLADPLSQLRGGPHHDDHVIAGYDGFLRSAGLAASLQPDLLLRFGAAPTSKALSTYQQRYADVRQVLVSPDGHPRDPELTAHEIVHADPASLCEALLDALPETAAAEPAWLGRWQAADRAAAGAISAALSTETRVSEADAVATLARVLPEGATVFAGNSMPVRDLDSFWPIGPRTVRALGNRGASGIDGVVSTALGVAALSRGRVVLLIGDLSFYHDMNGLIAARRFGLDATIVLVNNDGGGIFSFLSQHDDPEHFEALFGTPHGLDFEPVARLYGLGWHRVETRDAYRAALEASFRGHGVDVIEIRTDREQNLALHQRIWRDVATAVTEATPK